MRVHTLTLLQKFDSVFCVFIPAKFGTVTKNPKLKAQVLEQPGSHLFEGKFVARVVVSPTPCGVNPCN